MAFDGVRPARTLGNMKALPCGGPFSTTLNVDWPAPQRALTMPAVVAFFTLFPLGLSALEAGEMVFWQTFAWEKPSRPRESLPFVGTRYDPDHVAMFTQIWMLLDRGEFVDVKNPAIQAISRALNSEKELLEFEAARTNSEKELLEFETARTQFREPTEDDVVFF
jgi:hypothetical protein